jgi:cytochrome P450
MNFPFLDLLPLPSRTKARHLVASFKNELKLSLMNSHDTNNSDEDMLGARMLAARASGQWSEQQLLDNLTICFVAGQENPQLAMISTLYLLAKHPVSLSSNLKAGILLTCPH